MVTNIDTLREELILSPAAQHHSKFFPGFLTAFLALTPLTTTHWRHHSIGNSKLNCRSHHSACNTSLQHREKQKYDTVIVFFLIWSKSSVHSTGAGWMLCTKLFGSLLCQENNGNCWTRQDVLGQGCRDKSLRMSPWRGIFLIFSPPQKKYAKTKRETLPNSFTYGKKKWGNEKNCVKVRDREKFPLSFCICWPASSFLWFQSTNEVYKIYIWALCQMSQFAVTPGYLGVKVIQVIKLQKDEGFSSWDWEITKG